MPPRIIYLARLSFRIGEIKSFPAKQKLKEFMSTEPDLQEILRGIVEWRKSKQTNKQKTPKDQKQQRVERTKITNCTGDTVILHLYLSIITLNVNGLNVSIKKTYDIRMNKKTRI